MAWAADPETLTYLRKQGWRWMAGFFQNVRLHLGGLVRRKPMLAIWIWTWLSSALANVAFFHRPAVAAWGFGAMAVVGVPLLSSMLREDAPR